MKCNRVSRVCRYVRIVVVASGQFFCRVRYTVANPLIRRPIFCLVGERSSSVSTGMSPTHVKPMGIVSIPAIIAVSSAIRVGGPNMKGVPLSENRLSYSGVVE